VVIDFDKCSPDVDNDKLSCYKFIDVLCAHVQNEKHHVRICPFTFLL
jgi:hypothetical protein